MFFKVFHAFEENSWRPSTLQIEAVCSSEKLVLMWHWYVGEHNVNSEWWAVWFARWPREQENDVAFYQTSTSS